MTEGVRTEVTVSVVSSGLLSLVASSSLDETFGSSLMRFHFCSRLDECVEDRLLAEYYAGRQLK